MKDNFRLLTCVVALWLSVFSVTATTIWKGQHYVDDWRTLEVSKGALTAISLEEYKAMRFYHECTTRDYLIFLLANWEEAGVIAKSEPATDETAESNPLKRYAEYAELDLTKVNPLTIIDAVNSDHLLVQMDKQTSSPFNLTRIELIPKDNVGATTIWSGEQFVNWGSTLILPSTLFRDAQPGNKLLLSLKGVEDDIELHANGKKLPGTHFSRIPGSSSYVVYMTQDMVDSCKVYGMELCGGGFTVLEAEIFEGKAGQLKDGKTIWTGYFWVDEWSNLEVFKEVLTAVKDWDKYKTMRFYSECPTTDNLIFLRANWEDPGVIAKSEPATDEIAGNPFKRYVGYAELDLTKVNPLTIIDQVASDRLMIQMDKQGSAAFNFTDVVLIPKYATIDEAANSTSEWAVFNGQTTDAHLVRTLVPGMYNTLCLPFNLDATQIAKSDLAGSKICALDKTILNGDEVTLCFKETTEIVAGTPYIIQPAQQVENPVFNNVVINATAPSTTETTDVIFHGIYTQTHLEAGNENLLFLGEDNTLYFPYAGDNESMKGLRGYFEIKSQPAQVIRRAAFRIGENSVVTSLEHVDEKATVKKIMMKNNIVIRTNGTEYFINGARK
ncbi:MAG: hypothetical protein KBS69_05525 [Bacteroidales bacterium]|nr:hypothetical protein [Candidatus Colicola caccequi]